MVDLEIESYAEAISMHMETIHFYSKPYCYLPRHLHLLKSFLIILSPLNVSVATILLLLVKMAQHSLSSNVGGL